MITEEEIKEALPNIPDKLLQETMDNYEEPPTDNQQLIAAIRQLVEWERGESDSLLFVDYVDSQYLRIKGDKVEVSNGTKAPIEFCQYINTIRHTDTDIPQEVAGFTINSVEGGNVHIDSCIYLTKEVLDAFAEKHPELFGG